MIFDRMQAINERLYDFAHPGIPAAGSDDGTMVAERISHFLNTGQVVVIVLNCT
jgi:hypothetical protein